MTRDNVEQLMLAAQEGRLSQEEAAEWSRLLETDPAAVAEYVRHAALQGTLHHHFHSPEGLKLEEDREGLHSAVATLTGAGQKPFRWARYAAAAAIFLVAAIVIFFLLRPSAPAVSTSVMLTDTVNAEWDVPVSGGLPTTPISLRRGIAQFKTRAGATIVLQAPATVQFGSDSQCTLMEGTLTAHVPPAAVGFSVTTPQVTVRDLGTEFGVYTADNRTHAEVFVGRVEVTGSHGTPHVLEANQAVVVSDGNVAATALEPLAFLRPEAFPAATQGPADPVYVEWLAFSKQLRALPETVAYYPFDNEKESPRKVLNRAAGSVGREDGTIDRATWSQGRFAQKSALTFDGITSRVRVAIPGTLTNFTIAAWINADELYRRTTSASRDLMLASLLSSDGNLPPRIEWMIYRGSHPALRVAPTNPSSFGMRRYDSPNPISSPEVLHKWSLLAVTVDTQAKTVKHYLNGRLLVSMPLHEGEDPAASFGQAEMGAYSADTESDAAARRGFKGSIDELVVLSRPLTSQEIAAMYMAGNVDQ